VEHPEHQNLDKMQVIGGGHRHARVAAGRWLERHSI
jgi:hypothetical protein